MILELNHSLYYLIGNSIIRLVVIDELSDLTVTKIRAMRPSPSYYFIYASTDKMERLFKTVIITKNNINQFIKIVMNKNLNFKIKLKKSFNLYFYERKNK